MGKRRGNGEGGISQRDDGRWCASIHMVYSGGRRRRKWIYLDHIIEHLRRILAYTQDGREVFLSSLLVQDAVIRNFEIIGEAAKRISEERRAAAPEIPGVGSPDSAMC